MMTEAKSQTGLRLIGILTVAAVSLLTAAPAAAQVVYRRTDENGTLLFTNVPSHGRFQRIRITPRGFVDQPARSRVDLDARPPVYHGYDPLIARASRAYRVDPALVKAVIAAESNFNASARSRKGAIGLMQLMPATARELGVREPSEPAPNVLGGTRYLRDMIDRFDDVSLALAAYNAGPHKVDRYGGIPPYRETRRYVKRVLDLHRRYDADFR